MYGTETDKVNSNTWLLKKCSNPWSKLTWAEQRQAVETLQAQNLASIRPDEGDKGEELQAVEFEV